MSVQLVIAEKPSVARSIAAVIGAAEKQNGYWQGGGYLVSWCIGHLVSFAEAGQYDEKYCKNTRAGYGKVKHSFCHNRFSLSVG